MKKLLLTLFLCPVYSFGQTLQSNPDLSTKSDYRIVDLKGTGDTVVVTYRFANDSSATKAFPLNGLSSGNPDIRTGLYIKREGEPFIIAAPAMSPKIELPEQEPEEPKF